MKTIKERAAELVQISTDIEFVAEALVLLQEIANAPEPEPVGMLSRNANGDVEFKATGDPYISNGMSVYTEQPANNQSDQHIEMVNQPAPSVPPADLVRDAEFYRWLRESNWYVGPDDFYADEAGGLENYQNENFSAENLDTKIKAAIERDKLKGGEA